MICSTRVLELWADLVEAQRGVHRYGGDTAEIYVYRFLPAGCDSAFATEEQIRKANTELGEVCGWFEELRAAKVTIDGRELGGWLRQHQQRHRWHVRVIDP